MDCETPVRRIMRIRFSSDRFLMGLLHFVTNPQPICRMLQSNPAHNFKRLVYDLLLLIVDDDTDMSLMLAGHPGNEGFIVHSNYQNQIWIYQSWES